MKQVMDVYRARKLRPTTKQKNADRYIQNLKERYSNDLEKLQDTEQAIENLINRVYEDGFEDGHSEGLNDNDSRSKGKRLGTCFVSIFRI